jgi:alpha/beta superfamily hydrolase
MPDITFAGPEGRIEGKYFQAADPQAPIAIVMHPHPQHGGTMNNKVTYRMFESFARCGFSVLRFNFRGVGNSEGYFDNGVGEINDASAALDWLHAQHPHAKQIWVAGFSFGSWVMLQLLMRRPDIHRFIAVSTPAGNYDHSFFSPCPTSGMFLVGTGDEITPYEDVEEMLKNTARQKDIKIHYSKIEGADHFYTNHPDELSKRLCQYIISNKE